MFPEKKKKINKNKSFTIRMKGFPKSSRKQKKRNESKNKIKETKKEKKNVEIINEVALRNEIRFTVFEFKCRQKKKTVAWTNFIVRKL